MNKSNSNRFVITEIWNSSSSAPQFQSPELNTTLGHLLKKEVNIINAKSSSLYAQYRRNYFKRILFIIIPIIVFICGVLTFIQGVSSFFGSGDDEVVYFFGGFIMIFIGLSTGLSNLGSSLPNMEECWKEIENYIHSRFKKFENGSFDVTVEQDEDIYNGSLITYRNIIIQYKNGKLPNSLKRPSESTATHASQNVMSYQTSIPSAPVQIDINGQEDNEGQCETNVI